MSSERPGKRMSHEEAFRTGHGPHTQQIRNNAMRPSPPGKDPIQTLIEAARKAERVLNGSACRSIPEAAAAASALRAALGKVTSR